MIIHVSLKERSYDIVFEHGVLKKAGELLDLNRKAFIVTDDGVPEVYAETVCSRCAEGYIFTVPSGEQSKSIEQYSALLAKMLELGFTRKDCVIAVGGGVVGDLAGFTAASYMRGIDFYNVPTTLLSQVDSSIGGKTAVNLNGVKNIAGAFYQPKKVLIDPDVLTTLPRRQINNGLAEALKMSLTSDKVLFGIFENEDILDNLDTIIVRSLQIKRDVVEQDEKENGLRRILNFGHTIGHAIESEEELNGLYHGECVALGMIPMCSEAMRSRLINVLHKIGLPTELEFDTEAAMNALLHDKKAEKDGISATVVISPGEYVCRVLPREAFPALLRLIQKR
jgi:3-dehydroquinate synthase